MQGLYHQQYEYWNPEFGVLYYVIIQYIPYSTIFYYTIQNSTILYYTLLYHTILYSQNEQELSTGAYTTILRESISRFQGAWASPAGRDIPWMIEILPVLYVYTYMYVYIYIYVEMYAHTYIYTDTFVCVLC